MFLDATLTACVGVLAFGPMRVGTLAHQSEIHRHHHQQQTTETSRFDEAFALGPMLYMHVTNAMQTKIKHTIKKTKKKNLETARKMHEEKCLVKKRRRFKQLQQQSLITTMKNEGKNRASDWYGRKQH